MGSVGISEPMHSLEGILSQNFLVSVPYGVLKFRIIHLEIFRNGIKIFFVWFGIFGKNFQPSI